LQQIKEATKRQISNETLQYKDAANCSAAKIANETLQERSI
jgi:hypothetical protein